MSERYEQVLERDGMLAFTLVGDSMLPLLRAGRDVMIVRRKGDEPLRRLDVVLFRRQAGDGRGTCVLHRILRVHGDGSYWIVGDNCQGGEHVAESQVLGKLVAVVREGGREFSMDALPCRVFARLWGDLWPVRFAVLRMRSAIGRRLRRFSPTKSST